MIDDRLWAMPVYKIPTEDLKAMVSDLDYEWYPNLYSSLQSEITRRNNKRIDK